MIDAEKSAADILKSPNNTVILRRRILEMRKTKLIKLESSDGEVHFQECKTDFCKNAKEYDEEKALEVAKKEAKKNLLLKRSY